jgi:DNA-binding response OmpR family regulator
MSPHSITQIMPFEYAEARVEEITMQRILAIDDDPAVTSLLKRGLAYEGYAVDVAGSGEAGLALAREHHPHLAILDIMMPGMSPLPVIMLTARDAPADQVQGLEAGADDYVVKPFTFEVLLARVRAQLRRQQTDHPPQLRFADLTLDTASHIVRREQREITLTSLEFRLLQTFLEHSQQVLSKELLLDRVWGYDFGGNANVVEVYVKQLRQKLEAAGEARLLHTIRGAGYVLREE